MIIICVAFKGKSLYFAKKSICFTPFVNIKQRCTFVLQQLQFIRNMSVTGNLLSWKITPAQIEQSSKELIEKMKKIYDDVGKLKPEEVSYTSVVKVCTF